MFIDIEWGNYRGLMAIIRSAVAADKLSCACNLPSLLVHPSLCGGNVLRFLKKKREIKMNTVKKKKNPVPV